MPKYLSIGIFVYLLISNIRFLNRSSIIPYSDYIFLLLFVVSALIIVSFHRSMSINKSFFPLMILWFSLMILSLLSTLWSSHPQLTLQRTLLYFGPSIVIIYLSLADQQINTSFQTVSRLFVVYGFLTSTFAILLFLFGTSGTSPYGQIQYISLGGIEISQRVYGQLPRISSVFANPNTFASILAVSIIFTIREFIHSNRFTLFGIILLTQLVALFLTFSRTALLSLFASIICIFILMFFNTRELKNIFSFILKSLIILLTIVFGIVVSFDIEQVIADRVGVGTTGRVAIWSSTLDGISGSYLLGVGWGVSNEAVLLPQGIELSVHSVYFLALAEIGSVGVIILLLFLIFSSITVFRSSIHSENNVRVDMVVFISFICLISIYSIFEIRFLRPFNIFQFVFFYYLIYIVRKSNP